MPFARAVIPYCGTAPVPEEIWTRWNLDPVLIVALGIAAFVCARAVTRARPDEPHAERAFWAGWGVAAVALLSPLCSLSVALFSARVAQHMLLLLVAAPLMVFSMRGVSWDGAPAWLRGAMRTAGGVPAAWTAFAVFLWLWHTPAAYAATFESDAAYWAMHLTLFGSSVLLWRVLLPYGPVDDSALTRFVAGFTTLLHMGLLGALITFAPTILYSPHVLTTFAWGLLPIEDQQLGGLIMWVPGASAFMAAGLASIAMLLRPRAPSR
jgi:putative membrane protein